MYGAVVVFYEPMSEEEYCEEMRKSLGVGGEVRGRMYYTYPRLLSKVSIPC